MAREFRYAAIVIEVPAFSPSRVFPVYSVRICLLVPLLSMWVCGGNCLIYLIIMCYVDYYGAGHRPYRPSSSFPSIWFIFVRSLADYSNAATMVVSLKKNIYIRIQSWWNNLVFDHIALFMLYPGLGIAPTVLLAS
jgi:hypothetical protein